MDTTDPRFDTHDASKRGLDRDASNTFPGLFLHPVLAVEAITGGITGLVDCSVLNRTEGKLADHEKRAAADKASQRWLDGAEQAAGRLGNAARITLVGDRESNIDDLIACRPADVDLPCRSALARAITTDGLLPAHCNGLPEQGRETIEVPPKGNQPASQAPVAPWSDAISLKRPPRPGNEALRQSVPLWVVDVREIDPPTGTQPVHRRLLTTHTLNPLAAARQIVGPVSPTLGLRYRPGMAALKIQGLHYWARRRAAAMRTYMARTNGAPSAYT
jgi:hypothetical protein